MEIFRRVPRIFWCAPVLAVGLALLLSFFGDIPNALRWPARFLIVLLSLLLLWRFPGDSRAAVSKGTEFLKRVGSRCAAPILNARLWKPLEMLAAVTLVCIATYNAGLAASFMAMSSLRTDEITSITRYSGQGPMVTATEYRRANNHIFFNLLNSVTPGAGSFHPLRARMWSFVSVAALLALILVWFWSRTAFAAGAIVYSVVALNSLHLVLALEARAYGMIAFLATLAGISFLHHRTHGDRLSLSVLGITTLLGTYALPYYVVFGGLLILVLWLERPNQEVFLAGLWTAVATLLLYLPVLENLLDVAGSYDDDYETHFSHIGSAISVLAYLVPGGVPGADLTGVVLGVTVAFFICLLPPVTHSREAKGGLILATVCLAFVAFCFVLGTPPRRVTAFLAPPFALALAVAAFYALNAKPYRGAARILGMIACVAITVFAWNQLGRESFTPHQKWREFGRVVQVLFPEGTQVWFDTDRLNNAAYLDGKYPLLEEGSALPQSDIEAGRTIVHDANYSYRTLERVITREELPDGIQNITFKTSGGSTTLWFQPSSEIFEVGHSQETRGNPTQALYVIPLEGVGTANSLLLRRENGWDGLQRDGLDSLGLDYVIEGEALALRRPEAMTQELRIILSGANAAEFDNIVVIPTGSRSNEQLE